jgi:hypothetical protein
VTTTTNTVIRLIHKKARMSLRVIDFNSFILL